MVQALKVGRIFKRPPVRYTHQGETYTLQGIDRTACDGVEDTVIISDARRSAEVSVTEATKRLDIPEKELRQKVGLN